MWCNRHLARTSSTMPCKRSRCAACTTTMRTSTRFTHATRAYVMVSSCHCVEATAAHHKRVNVSTVNKNAAFVALRPPSSAQLCKALRSCRLSRSLLRLGGKSAAIAAKGPMLQTPGDCGRSGNMRMAAACAPAICVKRSVAGSAAPRATQDAAPTTPSLCKASRAQLNN